MNINEHLIVIWQVNIQKFMVFGKLMSRKESQNFSNQMNSNDFEEERVVNQISYHLVVTF